MSIESQRPIRYVTIEAFEAGSELVFTLVEFADVVLTRNGQPFVVMMPVTAWDQSAREAASRASPNEPSHSRDTS